MSTPEPEWRNLATVPSDGTRVLLLGRKDQVVFGSWNKGYGMCPPDLHRYVGLVSDGAPFDAVAWAPIPKIPKADERKLPDHLLDLMQKSGVVESAKAMKLDEPESRLLRVSEITSNLVHYVSGTRIGTGTFTAEGEFEDLAVRMNRACVKYKQDFKVWCSHILLDRGQSNGIFLFPLLPDADGLPDGASGVLLSMRDAKFGVAPATAFADVKGAPAVPKFTLDGSCGSGNPVDSARKDLAALLLVAHLHQAK